MKNFISKALVFISLPLILICLIDLFLRNQSSLYKEKYEGAIRLKDSIEVVVLGNSHANYGINPNAFDLFAYNLANVNQSIYFDKRIMLSLIPNLKKVKFVIISIDYHSLYFSSQGIRDKWSYYGNRIRYKETNYLLANLSPTLFGYSTKVTMSLLKKSIINKLKYGNKIFDVEDGVNLQDSISRGFMGFDGNDEKKFRKSNYKLRCNEFNKIIEESNEKAEIVADLDHFLGFLLSKKMTPIIITSPTYREYNYYLEKHIIKNNTKEIKNICQKYNIKYWDFMNSDVFLKKDFYNCDHLNKMGSLKFSKILNDSINNLKAEAGN